jgi:hypothetical protein
MGRTMSRKTLPWREILFTAKTGFMSKALWREFFTNRSESRNSRVWNGYTRGGFFKKHDSKMLPGVLVLAEAAAAELEKRGIPLVTKPHLGQFDHDEKTARILLKLLRENILDGYTTEAELKRKFMVWMKTTRDGKDAKFPDLTLNMKHPCKFRRVALEIEQSMKSQDRYRKVMTSYSSAKDVDAVIFISDRQTIFGRIARAMREVHYPSWERPVGFGEMEAWLKDPISAPIYLSRGVSSLREWMAGAAERAA